MGAGLRVWQYGSNSSLWLDEAALSRNILERSARELLDPLSYGQVAPIGFLLVQKLVVALFGPSEYALRAFALACGLISLPLFARCATAFLQRGAALFAVLLFALGQPFIYFSSQAKQYAPDVAFSLLALLLGCRLIGAHAGTRRLTILALAGTLIPWFSQTAALVLVGAAAGALTTMIVRGDRRGVPSVLSPVLLWVGSSSVAGWLATGNMPAETREYLDWFWRMGFMPLSAVDAPRWAWRMLVDVFEGFNAAAFRTNGGLGYIWPQLFAVAVVIGFVQLVKTRRDVALILLGPLAAALSASALRLYPLSGRLLVFIVPLLLLVAAAGAQSAWSWFGTRARPVGVAILLIFVAIPIEAAVRTRPPYSIQPLRTVLERMNPLRQPGDTVYVDYAAAQAFLYYAPRFGFKTGDYVIGDCAVTDRRDYLRQVDRFRGRRRLWIVATHLSAVERSVTVGYLERIGRRLASVFVPPAGAHLRFAAYARLYDLSDPRRLASADAATHQIREVPMDVDMKQWGCAGPVVLEDDEAGQ